MNPSFLALLLAFAPPLPQEPPVKIAPPKGSPEALAAIADEVIKEVERIRGLKFKRPVPKHVRTKEELRRFLADEAAKEWPAEIWDPRERFYKRLGLLPVDCDLRSTMVELLLEQGAGFYFPETGEFIVVGSYGPGIDRITVVHELTHALDDQHFDLKRLQHDARDEEDRSFVVSAVAEGSATYVHETYTIGRAARAEPSMAAKLLEEAKELEAIQTEQFRRAPPYLQRGLLALYVQGKNFLQKGNGTPIPSAKPADIDRAFHTLPRSSEQVLHPEKYWFEGAADEPVEVALPDFGASLGEGWKKVDESTLGEMNTALLVGEVEEMPAIDMKGPDALEAVRDFVLQILNESWTNEAAEGWGGDRFAVYTKGKALAGVWMTVWDTPKDVVEFTSAWTKYRGDSAVRKQEKDRVVLAVGEGVDRGLLERLAGQALREAKTRALDRPAESGTEGDKPH
ncbi:MAG TPA: hypothetical protein VFI25_04295 [Planctomycetota bacterium]|jgi:hypothetical protein|nr:hypothetical protein [Planctomycetota bacterium]